MLLESPSIILVTGIMASGKSTVAGLLAEQLEKSVHIRGDLFRRMIVNNRKEMNPDFGQDEMDQLRLRYRLATQAADTYVDAGFTAVVQDVVIGPVLQDFISYIRHRPLYVVVLCPNPSVVAHREATRSKKGYGDWTVEALDNALRHDTPRIGMWVDSSDMTPEQTAAHIWKNIRTEGIITG